MTELLLSGDVIKEDGEGLLESGDARSTDVVGGGLGAGARGIDGGSCGAGEEVEGSLLLPSASFRSANNCSASPPSCSSSRSASSSCRAPSVPAALSAC